MTWNQIKANFLSSPKSTITGLCGAAIAIILAVMALPPKASAGVIAVAILRALVDFSKTDAGKVVVTSSANPEPHLEPSTEVPLNPAATPVAKE
jgi:hypothetical protein